MAWFVGKKQISLHHVASDCAAGVIRGCRESMELCSECDFEPNAEQRREILVMQLLATTLATLSTASKYGTGRVLADAIQYEVYMQAFESDSERNACSSTFCKRWREYINSLPPEGEVLEDPESLLLNMFSNALGIRDLALQILLTERFIKTMLMVKESQAEIFEKFELVV